MQNTTTEKKKNHNPADGTGSNHDSTDLYPGTIFIADWSGTNFPYQSGYLLLIVFTGLEAWNVKLRHLPSDWTGWSTGIFRIYRWTGETFWSNRWIFNRIYSNGNHCRYCN